MTLLAELGDLRRFGHPRDLMTYLGRAVGKFQRAECAPWRHHEGARFWRLVARG